MSLERKRIAVVAAFCCAVVCGTAVNFLAKRAALTEPPIALSGWRTLTAALILLFPMLMFHISMRVSPSEIRFYLVYAFLTMGVPQALIFFGLRKLGVAETTVAFVEAAVLGIVVVYLLASRKTISKGALICTALTLIGMGIFLRIRPSALAEQAGDICIIAAAIATGVGLIISEKIEPRPDDTSFRGKCKRSTKKTFFACVISGTGTLVVSAGFQYLIMHSTKPLQIPAAASWPWVVALAIVGSCLTWFSLFLLIEFGQLVLAAAVMAAAPVTTEIANYIWFTRTINTLWQWFGGASVLLSLVALIWLQLVMTREGNMGSAHSSSTRLMEEAEEEEEEEEEEADVEA